MTSRGRCAVVLRHGRWSSRAVGTDGGRSGRAVQAAGACGRAVRRIAGSVSFVEIVDHYTVYRYIYIYIRRACCQSEKPCVWSWLSYEKLRTRHTTRRLGCTGDQLSSCREPPQCAANVRLAEEHQKLTKDGELVLGNILFKGCKGCHPSDC